jgi:hypothetical protein
MSFDTNTFDVEANEEFPLPAPVNYVRLISASDSIFLRAGNHFMELELGLGFAFNQSYDRVYIKSETEQTIKITYGKGRVDDNRLVGNVDISGGIKLSSYPTSSYGTVTVDSTATLIRNSNNLRGRLTLQNHGGDIWIGNDNSVTDSNGIKINANSTAVIESNDAIYGIALTDGQDIRYWEDELS